MAETVEQSYLHKILIQPSDPFEKDRAAKLWPLLTGQKICIANETRAKAG